MVAAELIPIFKVTISKDNKLASSSHSHNNAGVVSDHCDCSVAPMRSNQKANKKTQKKFQLIIDNKLSTFIES